MTLTIDGNFLLWVLIAIPPFLAFHHFMQSERKEVFVFIGGAAFWAFYFVVMYFGWRLSETLWQAF